MKEIPLSQGKIAIVDDDDFEKLNKHKWYALTDGRGHTHYVIRNSPRSSRHRNSIKMHRVIMNPPKGKEIDHINGNALDNRKENLRIVTHRQNMQNQHISKTSKHPGVYWDKKNEIWSAQIRFGGKRRHLGRFADEGEAATTYRVACVVLTGVEAL